MTKLRSLEERLDILALRILTLESAVGLDRVEAEVHRRIAAESPNRTPVKAARRKKEARP